MSPMKNRITYFLLSLSLTPLSLQAQPNNSAPKPEWPAKDIDTRVIKFSTSNPNQLEHTQSYMPSLKTTGDGRLGVNFAGNRLFVLKPENLSTHFNDSSGAQDILGNQVGYSLTAPTNILRNAYVQHINTNHIFKNGKRLEFDRVAGVSLCEPTYFLGGLAHEEANPKQCESQGDCYNITLVHIIHLKEEGVANGPQYATLASVDLEVRVAQAKKSDARVEEVSLSNTKVNGGLVNQYGLNNMMEINTVGDGRLIVGRMAYKDLEWQDDDPSQTMRTTQATNIFYSVYPTNQSRCDVNRWTEFFPISHAHYDEDNNMKTRFKFAHFPFRDGLGNIIPDGADIYGSYPWMDRKAANLMFTSLNKKFYLVDGSGVRTEYPDTSTAKPTTPADRNHYQSNTARTMGVSVMGLWTRGKMILLDGLINNTDYTLRFLKPNIERKMSLYTDAVGNSGDVYTGVGRERDLSTLDPTVLLPEGFFGNASHIESWENKFNYSPLMKPTTPRDLVWHVTNGRYTQEVVFDDYSNPNILISSSMVGALSLEEIEASQVNAFGAFNSALAVTDPNTIKTRVIRYQDGFRHHDYRFDDLNPAPVMIQNAATTRTQVFDVPPAGVATSPDNSVRIEPIAMGGIEGKGLWLNNTNGVAYTVPGAPHNDTTTFEGKEWYFSVFVDRRIHTPNEFFTLFQVTNDQGKRSRIGLRGNNEIHLLRERTGGKFHQTRVLDLAADTPSLLLRHGDWIHLGFSINAAQTEITVYVQGYPARRWTGLSGNPFKIGPGSVITLGKPNDGRSNEFDDPDMEGGAKKYPDQTEIRGFRGWLDDFRVIAKVPTLEEICNDARGTLIKTNGNSYWHNRAGEFRTFGHTLVRNVTSLTSSDLATCYVKNNDHANPLASAKLDTIPPNTVSLREEFVFPGTAHLSFGSPRPDSSTTPFCLSCHGNEANNHNALGINVLEPSFNNAGTARKPMQWDLRQPLQPPRGIWGRFREVIHNPVSGSNQDGDQGYFSPPQSTGNRTMIDQFIHP